MKSVRPSTSTQFKEVNQTFAADCEALEKSIKKLKSRASAAGQSESVPSSSQCCNRRPSLPSAITTDESRLANRAKDLRTMTEKVIYINYKTELNWLQEILRSHPGMEKAKRAA